MINAYILIAAILLLGGLIAVLGDILGSKVGKARLRLFNLRPRRTAMLITVMTGFSISAFTLGVLFTLNKSLRQGIFELDTILIRLKNTRSDLEQTQLQIKRVELELQQAKNQKQAIETNLALTNHNFQQATVKLKNVSFQADSLRAEVKSLIAERKKLSQQRENLKQQIIQLKKNIDRQNQLLLTSQNKITQQDRIIKDKEQLLVNLEKQQSRLQAEIEERDRILQVREIKLKQIERKFAFINQQLEQYYQNFREKTIALFRGQILAFATVNISDPQNTTRVIDRILQEANLRAIQAVNPAEFAKNKLISSKIIIIDRQKIQDIIKQVRDGQEYVVRILSEGNYVEGEREIRVIADVVPNRKIFTAEQTVASITLESNNFNPEEIGQNIDLLLSISRLRARRSGILGNVKVGDGNFEVVFNFFEELKKSQTTPTTIKAVAIEEAYAAGPLKLRLVALRDGQILFST